MKTPANTASTSNISSISSTTQKAPILKLSISSKKMPISSVKQHSSSSGSSSTFGEKTFTLDFLCEYFESFLENKLFPNDISKNGLQVQNSSPCSKKIRKIAFAVDACLDTIMEAKKQNADLLFVHHGLFWGDCKTLTKTHYSRIAQLIQNDIALYACHIPLDANKIAGNNYGMANILKLCKKEPFGVWHNMTLGVKGVLKQELSTRQIASLLLEKGQSEFCLLPFGKEKNKTVGIISGGSGSDVEQAVNEGLDIFICGDYPHECYHFAKENKMNVLALGHYFSETVGVRLVLKKVQKELALDTCFIDCPTGL